MIVHRRPRLALWSLVCDYRTVDGLQVEESLEEAVLELRSKKREMQHMKHRVEGIVRAVQGQSLGRGGVPSLGDADRGRMHAEVYQ